MGGGGLDRPKMMAYGHLRFWAAGKLAYESEAWPQVFFVDTLFPKNDQNQCVDQKSVENRLNSLKFVVNRKSFESVFPRVVFTICGSYYSSWPCNQSPL